VQARLDISLAFPRGLALGIIECLDEFRRQGKTLVLSGHCLALIERGATPPSCSIGGG
jgi:hypothetical protein